MAISTHESLARLRNALERRDRDELADFIADLAAGDPEVGELAAIFAERGDPAATTEKLKAAIARLRREEEFICYDDAFHFSTRLLNLLERIEKDLLPVCPNATLDVLAAFISADGDLAERVDDSAGAVGEPMSTACELFARAVANGGSRDRARALFDDLTAKDFYGYRQPLLGLESRIFGAETLDAEPE